MQFRSIQNRILVLAGVAMTTALVILILLNQYSGRQTQQLTIDSSRAALQQEAWQKVSANARAEAATITQLLQRGSPTPSRWPASSLASRRASCRWIASKPPTCSRPSLLWSPSSMAPSRDSEPNGFDGRESFAGQSALGSDDKGRFVPYFYRDKEQIGSDLLLSIERAIRTSSATRPTTTTPARNGRGALPHRSLQGGHQRPAGAGEHHHHPILVDGQFKGIAALDLAVDSISRQAQSLNSNIYDGKGKPDRQRRRRHHRYQRRRQPARQPAPTRCSATAGSSTSNRTCSARSSPTRSVSRCPSRCRHGPQLGHHRHPALQGGAGGSGRAGTPAHRHEPRRHDPAAHRCPHRTGAGPWHHAGHCPQHHGPHPPDGEPGR